MRRPSPALVIALLALAGTWGGPAVAGQLIGSKQVRNNSLTTYDVKDRSLRGRDMRSNTLTGRVVAGLSGRDIRRDSLDGSNIDESSLGEVPRAAAAGSADSAAHAATADALTGTRLIRLAYARPVSAETTTLLDEGGLKLSARCTGAGSLAVEATASGSSGGLLHVSATRPGNGDAVSEVANDNDLRATDTVNVLPAGADNSTGTLVFHAPNGETVSASFLAQQGLGIARGYQCVYAGTAIHTSP